jgi:aspartate racemase
MKKKLGILGGMGSRAGALFLQRIIDFSPAETDQDFIEIILHSNSAIPDRTRAIINKEESPLSEILRSVSLFNQHKVDAIALSCITSYYYYLSIAEHTQARIMHPVLLVREFLAKHHPDCRKIGLLATTGTIRSNMFQHELEKVGIDVVTLNDADQHKYFMEPLYMKNGLKSAVISDEALALFMESTNILLAKGVDAIVGGCSEVPIALKQEKLPVLFIDTLEVLAKETVNYCYDLTC